MRTLKINKKKEYTEIMMRIEQLLQKATQNGGLHTLTACDVKILKKLSLLAEQYEDSIPLMPMKSPLRSQK
jgi:HTH-type transcriptional regulator/antitoxin HigA